MGEGIFRPSQVNWPRQTDREQTDREPMVSLQWFGHSFCRSDFVTKWGFGQDGSGDSKNIFRIALLSQLALLAVSLFAVSLFAVSLLRSVVVDPFQALKYVYAKRRLKSNNRIFARKISFLALCWANLMQFNCITTRGSPPIAGEFFWFFVKNSHFTPFE